MRILGLEDYARHCHLVRGLVFDRLPHMCRVRVQGLGLGVSCRWGTYILELG